MSRVVSPSLIYVVKSSNTPALNKMAFDIKMSRLCPVEPDRLKVEDAVCFQGKRGRVKGLLKDRASVQLIDEGRVMEIKWEYLFILPDAAAELPPLAVACKLRYKC